MPKKINGQEPSKTQIKFTSDFHQETSSELKAGSEVQLAFDSARLPYERSIDKKGKPEWTISAYCQFSPTGSINEIKLQLPKNIKKSNSTEPVILTGEFTIPATSTEISIWFLNTGATGIKYYDSAFGRNYRYQVKPELTATVAPAKKTRAKKAS